MSLDNKCVIIIDESLPLGIIANTSAILGITIGKEMPEIVGQDVFDAENKKHMGITGVPVPILKGSSTKLMELRQELYKKEFAELLVVDFSNVAQKCNDYDDYIEKTRVSSDSDYVYYGIAIYGDKKKINKLTGSMPLLR